MFSRFMANKSPQIRSLIILSVTSQSSPRSAPRRTKKTYLSDRQQKKNSSSGSRRCRLQVVVLRLQAHVSYLSVLIFLFSLSHSPVPPGSLSTLSPSQSLSTFSSPCGESKERLGEKAKRDREGGKESRKRSKGEKVERDQG